MDVLVVSKGFLNIIKLVMGLHYRSFQVAEFMLELHHGTFEGSEASVEVSPHGLSHLYELVSGRLHKKD